MKKDEVGLFEKSKEFSVYNRNFPHWIQTGALCFVTWRAADSLPEAAIRQLEAEINQLILRENLNPKFDWKAELSKRPGHQRARFWKRLFCTRDKYLDAGYGRCLLDNKECAIEVEHSILHFDEERYFVTDIVVMPNHVHFIAAYKDEDTFLKQNTDWKRFTARKINRLCGVAGDFWQVDQFDHLIRHSGSFDYYRKYILDNPRNAGLSGGRYRHFSKHL